MAMMIGRGSIGHPFIFNEIKHFMATGEHTWLRRPWLTALRLAREHLLQLPGLERSVGRCGGDAQALRQLLASGLPNVKEVRLAALHGTRP
jgi:tRNA-dihydrouridine synthase B